MRALNSGNSRLWISAALMGVMSLLVAKPLPAQEADQQYTVLPYDALLKRDKDIPKILRGDKEWPLEPNKKYFRDYFNNFVFAAMTLPENVDKLPELRREFYKEIWRTRELETVYPFVNEVTIDAMRKFLIPTNNFHPAVQYNAILIVGDLDEGPRSITGRQIKPVPWPGAVSTLIACATRDQFPDHIKAGAMIGLARHAQLGLPSESRESVIAAMMQLLKEKDPPEGRDREVHDWIRRRACDVLADAGQTGGDNGVPILLIACMNDPNATLAFRCSAARALGKLRYEGNLGINTKQLSDGLGELSVAVCIDAKKKADSAGADNAARLAAARLLQLKSGFAAPAQIAEPAEKDFAKNIYTEVDSMLGNLQQGAEPVAALDKGLSALAKLTGKAVPTATSAKTEEVATEKPAETEKPPMSIPLGGDDPF